MAKDLLSLLSGDVLEEEVEFTLTELSRVCSVSAERIIELVDEGLVEPRGRTPSRWRFHGVCVRRVRRALRLERDLGVNIAGAALALDLLDELEIMRARLRRLDT
jgi:chaperone modulatory protein CbpM